MKVKKMKEIKLQVNVMVPGNGFNPMSVNTAQFEFPQDRHGFNELADLLRGLKN
jgi:hypothetical protein